MATLSVAVMAHRRRSNMVDELLEQLDRPASVVWDRHNDRHDTGARAMAAFDPDCSHHLVLQDDVVPCRDLLDGAERAIEATPGDVPVSLYIGSVKPFSDAVEAALARADESTCWVTMEGIYWGPAVILPTAAIPRMLAWYSRARVEGYDARMSAWWKGGLGGRKRCWYTWPTLVDHRGDRSLVHRKASAGRRARGFIGAEESALSIDWTDTAVHMNRTDRLDRVRQQRARR